MQNIQPPSQSDFLAPVEQIELVRGEALSLPIEQPFDLQLWHSPKDARSFWVLFINGINDSREANLAHYLAFWQAIFSGSSACVRIVQSSERELFQHFSQRLGFRTAPVLFLSGSPSLINTVMIEEDLILSLAEDEGICQRFLTRLHTHLVHGGTIKELRKILKVKRLRHSAKAAYSEFKDLVLKWIS